MAKKNDYLVVGGVYTCESGIFARRILALERSDVKYADFGWLDGELISFSRMCSEKSFKRWAVRRIPDEECKHLPEVKALREMAGEQFEEHAMLILQTIPAEYLIYELKRRGLAVMRSQAPPKPSDN